MPNYQEKEKYSGLWKGDHVDFNRTWSNYRFTDAECEALLRGEKIVIGKFRGSNGDYSVEGHLDHGEFNGHKFIGFQVDRFISDVPPKEKVTGTWQGQEVVFNRVWNGHRFSDQEVRELLAGNEIRIENLVSKSNRPYGVHGKLERQTYNGHEFVGFHSEGFLDQ